jgi:hypothetical protein
VDEAKALVVSTGTRAELFTFTSYSPTTVADFRAGEAEAVLSWFTSVDGDYGCVPPLS